jgi:hypothetical protein
MVISPILLLIIIVSLYRLYRYVLRLGVIGLHIHHWSRVVITRTYWLAMHWLGLVMIIGRCMVMIGVVKEVFNPSTRLSE